MDNTIKKGRGRPRLSEEVVKDRLKVIPKSLRILSAESMDNTIKKGRGRPRLSEEVVKDRLKVKDNTIKKGRGRPRLSEEVVKDRLKVIPKSLRITKTYSRSFSTNRSTYDIKKSLMVEINKFNNISRIPGLPNINNSLLELKGILDNTSNTTCNTLQEQQKSIEKELILVSKNKENFYQEINNSASIERFSRVLVIEFGKVLGIFIFRAILKGLYYQIINFKPVEQKDDTLRGILMLLSPLVNYLLLEFGKERKKDLFTFYKKKVCEKFNDLIEKTLIKKSLLKDNKSLTVKINYDQELKDLNKILRKEKKSLSDINNREFSAIIIERLLDIFFEENYSTVTFRDKKNLHRYLNLTDWELIGVFNTFNKISLKPMIIQPKDWVLNDAGTPVNGGYLMNKDYKIIDFIAHSAKISPQITWSKDYVNDINLIQSFPIHINTNCIDIVVENFLKVIAPAKWAEIHNQYNVYNEYKETYKLIWEREGNIKPEQRSVNFKETVRSYMNSKDVYIHTIMGFFSKFRDIVSLLSIKEKYSINSDVSEVTLYFPTHVDVSLRMYQKGLINILANKYLRTLVIFPEPKSISLNPINEEQIKIFALSTLIQKTENIKSSQIFDLTKINNTFYFKLYNTKNMKSFWVDATAQALQIYSLLFGNLEFANASNLGNDENYCDIYTKIIGKLLSDPEIQTWSADKKLLLSSRSFAKSDIQYSLYGSIIQESTKRVLKFAPTLKPQEAREVADFFKKQWIKLFPYAFNLRKILEEYAKDNRDFDGFTWKLQLNVCKYSYNKFVKKKIRIKSDLLKVANQFELVKIQGFDRLKSIRTILTTIFHSLDAKINIAFRKKIYLDYGIAIPAVHDSFCIPFWLYDIALSLYKSIIFEIVFTLKLNDIICLPENSDVLKKVNVMQQEIDILKEDPKWLIYKNAKSQPLYPDIAVDDELEL
jgi:hypothetical protein